MLEPRQIRLARPRFFTEDQIAGMCESAIALLTSTGLRVRHEKLLDLAAKAGFRVVEGRVFPEDSPVRRFLEECRTSDRGHRRSEGGQEAPFRLRTCQYATHVHDLDTDTIVPYTTERLIEAAKVVDVLGDEGVVGQIPGCPGDVADLLQPILQYRLQAQHMRQGRRPIDAKWPRSLPYVMAMAEALDHPIRSLPVYVVSPLTIGSECVDSVLAVLGKLERLHVGNMPSVGATVPIGLANAFALGIAECAGAAFLLQAIIELPVSWSVSAMAFDLRGMAMSFGGPEHRLFCWAAEEVNAFCHGRELRAPGGWSALRTQAKLPGPQAAADKMAGAIMAAVLGTRDLDGLGSLSLDEVFSAEQAIFDCEIRDFVERFAAGVDVHFDPELLQAELPQALGAGFLSTDSTLSTYQDVYWLPRLSERRSLAGWLAADRPDLRDRAKALARDCIARHDYRLADDLERELDGIYADAEKDLLE